MLLKLKYKEETYTRGMEVQYLQLLLLGYITLSYGQDLPIVVLPGQGLPPDVLPPRCAAVTCLRPICLNPITPPGRCCPQCPQGPDCSAIACDPLPDCFNPFTPEGECCPRCGIDCRVVRCGSPPTNCPTVVLPGQCCPVCRPPPDCTAVLCPDMRGCPNPFTPEGECCARCGTNCNLVDCAPAPLGCETHIPDGECCPVCRPPPDCSTVFCPLLGDCPNRFRPPGECCDQCGIDCSLVRCAAPPRDCVRVEIPTGECCPICMDRTCNNNGQIVNEGETIQVDCNTCQCSGGQLLCTLIACENHPGTCPVVRGAGICVEMCSFDSDCTQQQKCCSNGCGHVCMDVIPSTCNVNGQIVNEGDSVKVDCNTCTCRNRNLGCTKIACIEKPGTCPALRNPVVGRCPDGCSSDHDCPKQQKCCTVGCGRACFDPLPSSCVVKGKTINDGDSVKVDCNTCTCSNGNLQCTEIACVDRPGSCPQLRLSAVGLCAEFCSSDHDCQNPRQKCCSYGCGHSCMNAVSAQPDCTFVTCPGLPRRCRRRRFTPQGECCPVCRPGPGPRPRPGPGPRPRPGPGPRPRPGPQYGRRRPVNQGYGRRRDTRTNT